MSPPAFEYQTLDENDAIIMGQEPVMKLPLPTKLVSMRKTWPLTNVTCSSAKKEWKCPMQEWEKLYLTIKNCES